MKLNSTFRHIPALLIIASTLYSCSKSNEGSPLPVKTVDVTPKSKHVYGLLPTTPEEYASIPVYSKDEFQHKYALSSITPAPAVMTLATPAVRDQGQIGACTGFCGAEAYEILWNYKYGSFPPILSPAFLYYEERVKLRKENIVADDGANMINIDQVLTRFGITTEDLYAYPANDYSKDYATPPSAVAISTALGYRIGSYTLIKTGDTAAVKNCIRNHIPVMMGFNVYDNVNTYAYFENLSTTRYTYNPINTSGTIAKGLMLLGAHATPIVGYNDNRKAFLVQNSWGTSWGLNGFYYMPYKVFANPEIVPPGNVYFTTL
jgi:hypothetical protein